MNSQRHTEFFGPDLARGPFSASALETAVVQIATALAQLRAPLARDDNTILAHADFIRTLADRLAPTVATAVHVDISDAAGLKTVTFRASTAARTLLRMWLADTNGGGQTNMGADSFTWLSGSVVDVVAPEKQYVFATDASGTAVVQIGEGGLARWYIGVARGSAVTYAGPLQF